MPSSRTDQFVLAAAVIWLAVQVSPLWYPAPDSGAYLSIARGLARDGVLLNHGRPQLYYSVGYPLLIAPLYLVGDEPFLRIAVLHFALGVAVLALTYHWVRGIAPEHAAWVAALTVCSAAFGTVYRRPLSETAFMTAMLAGVVVLNRVSRREGGWPVVALGALLAVAAVLTRPAGLTLAAGFGAVLLRSAWRGERSWRSAVIVAAAVGIPPVVAEATVIVQDRVRAEQIGAISYTDQVCAADQSLAGQLAEGVRVRVQEVGRLLVPGMYKAVGRAGDWLNVNMLVYVPLAVAVGWGWVRLIRERGDVFAGLLPFYVLLYIVWPYDQGARFFTPLVPLFAICLVTLARTVSAESVRRVGVGLATAHLLVAIGYWQFADWPEAVRYNADRAAVRQLVDRVPPPDRAAVAVPERFGLTPGWADYYLDRLSLVWEPAEPPPAESRWALLPADDPPPSGFAAAAVAGRFRLCQRGDSSTARAHASDR
jgi:hypothetical protein